jgi:hypothetical protein
VFSIILSSGITAQTEQKLTKEQKKQEKKAREAEAWTKYNKLAAEKTFVVEITQAGNSNSLSPRLNFLYVNQDTAVIQLQSIPGISSNGLGGFTVVGSLSDYQYTAPKKENRPIYIQFNLQSKNRSGMVNISLTLYGDGTCDIDLGANADILHGNFMAPQESRVLMGADMLN